MKMARHLAAPAKRCCKNFRRTLNSLRSGFRAPTRTASGWSGCFGGEGKIVKALKRCSVEAVTAGSSFTARVSHFNASTFGQCPCLHFPPLQVARQFVRPMLGRASHEYL